MKVSIIIPCYNAAKYINTCLSKILEDKLPDKEIILINDGSNDNTLKILKQFQKKHKNIIILDQKNSGQAAARNKGIEKAKGEYITFIDIDDYPENNMIFEMYNYAKNHNYDYVYCDYYEHYKDRNIFIKNHHTSDIVKDAVLANFAPWGKLISKKLIEDTDFKFCNGKIFEDIAVIPYIAAKSKNPGYLPKCLYYYNMSNTNSTTRKKEYDKRYEDMFFASDHLYELFQKDNLIEKYYEELSYIFLDGILKSGVLKFAKYKEGIPNISLLRKNVKTKFRKLLNNKYYKKDSLYRKLTAFMAYYLPPKMLYLLKRVKK